jgi:GMP synthase-like glutamine amidotransferase
MSIRNVVHFQCLKDAWPKPIEDAALARVGKIAVEELRVIPAWTGDFQPDLLDDATHLTIGGSGWSVWENTHRSAELEQTVKEARRRGIPILGICFGGQFLAQIFGGAVVRAPSCAEYGTIGVRASTEAKNDPLFGPCSGQNFLAQASHQDRIVLLPQGAVKLAWSHVGETYTQIIQAFGFPGEKVWGVQFHPERDKAAVLASMAHPECDYSPAKRAVIAELLRDSPDAGALFERFLDL